MSITRRAAVLLCLAIGACSPDQGPELLNGRIVLPPPGMQMAAAYMEIRNNSNQSLQVLSVDCPAYRMAEIHETTLIDGVSQMREVANLPIEPKETLRFEPGGKHVMLMGPLKDAHQFRNLPVRVELMSDDGKITVLESRFEIVRAGDS